MRDRSSVSIIFNSGSIVLIRRIERPDDPWSGQIALPGGFAKPGESNVECAVRETREEVGILLGMGSLVGEMGPFHPFRFPHISVFPVLFRISEEVELRPGPEVAEARFVPLHDLRPDYLGEHPAFRYRDWYIWGLTFRILQELLGNSNLLCRLYSGQ